MNNLFQTFLVGAGWLLAPSLVGAQTSAEPKAKGREIRMIAWAPIGHQLTCGADPAAQTLSLSTTQLSRYNAESTGDNLEIYTPVEAADGKIQNMLYAAAPWPDKGLRFLGVLGPGADEAVPRGKLFLLPDSLKLYPEHSVRVMNLTPAVLAVKVGGKEYKLKTRGECVVPYQNDRKNMELSVAMPDQQGGWKMALSAYLTTSRHFRSVVILRPNPSPVPGEDATLPVMLQILDQTSPRAPEITRAAPDPEKEIVPDAGRILADPSLTPTKEEEASAPPP
jgi:hypothetical protein